MINHYTYDTKVCTGLLLYSYIDICIFGLGGKCYMLTIQDNSSVLLLKDHIRMYILHWNFNMLHSFSMVMLEHGKLDVTKHIRDYGITNNSCIFLSHRVT